MPDEPTTRVRILDAAEAMFADSGYDAVPVRAIMDLARARLGLLSYHFGTKEALFEAVIARRVDELTQRRRRLLFTMVADGNVTVGRLVDAYLHPYLDLMTSGDSGWKAYGRLIAQVAQSRRWSNLVHKYFDETAILFIDRLQVLYPKASRDRIIEAFVFFVGAMLNTFASSGRMESLSGGSILDDDFGEIYPRLVVFATSGLRSLLGDA